MNSLKKYSKLNLLFFCKIFFILSYLGFSFYCKQNIERNFNIIRDFKSELTNLLNQDEVQILFTSKIDESENNISNIVNLLILATMFFVAIINYINYLARKENKRLDLVEKNDSIDS